MATLAKDYFSAELAKLNYTTSHYGEGSASKMTRFVANLEKNTRKNLGCAPGPVKGWIVSQFANINWDFKGQCLADGKEAPDSATVVATLEALITYLTNLEGGGEAKEEGGVLGDAAEFVPPPCPEIPDPTEEELADVSKCVNRMFLLDPNHLHPDVDYVLDFQRECRPYAEGDFAPNPLFRSINTKKLDALPSFNLFLPLLDNYERGKGVAEKVTYTEKKETQAFLAHAVASAPMQFLQKVLVAQGKVGAGRGAMKNLLQEIWFDLYARGGRVKDSSGFEHVFIGEEKDGKVTGMHNWLQLLNEERHGRFNFEGHYKPKRRSNTNAMERYEKERIATLKFSWYGEPKPKSTTMFGITPEFEMAMYTLCFLSEGDDHPVQLGPYTLNIKSYSWGNRGKNYVATSYPEERGYSQHEAASKIQGRFRGNRGKKAYRARRN